MSEPSPAVKALIVGAEAVSAYGDGVSALVDGLYSSVSAVDHLSGDWLSSYRMYPVGAIPGLPEEGVRLFHILRRLAARVDRLPDGAPLYLAVTVGAIDLLESQSCEPHLCALIRTVKQLFGERRVVVVSGACAASTCAIARAAADIDAGRTDYAIVLACDALSEFIFSGFASLGALDTRPARPFDSTRAGLNLGEAAVLMILKSPRISGDNDCVIGRIAGWSLSADATHATSPDREGNGLARAIRGAMTAAGVRASEVSFIAAHGTGTGYNDAMELAALHQVFKLPRPVFSVKWGTGHTIAAAGMIQLIVACHAVKVGRIPPNALTSAPEAEAVGWIAASATAVDSGCFLSANSGFGGINAVLVVS